MIFGKVKKIDGKCRHKSISANFGNGYLYIRSFKAGLAIVKGLTTRHIVPFSKI